MKYLSKVSCEFFILTLTTILGAIHDHRRYISRSWAIFKHEQNDKNLGWRDLFTSHRQLLSAV